jgi:hypothetical protein
VYPFLGLDRSIIANCSPSIVTISVLLFSATLPSLPSWFRSSRVTTTTGSLIVLWVDTQSIEFLSITKLTLSQMLGSLSKNIPSLKADLGRHWHNSFKAVCLLPAPPSCKVLTSLFISSYMFQLYIFSCGLRRSKFIR